VLRTVLVLVAVLVAGCGWDGPPRDVQVVTSASGRSGPVAVPSAGGPERSGADATIGADAGGSSSADGRASTGLEDRPGTFGALDVPANVAVVGDSLTVAASDEITASLTRVGVRAVIVDGRESRRMATASVGLPSGVMAIEDILVEHRPDLWVVALGTNDVGADVGAERFRADLRETLAAIPSDAPLVWVDVWIRDRHDDVVELNAVLHGELADRAAPTTIVDWYATGSTDGFVTGDGVHLTAAGEERFAAQITDAVVALSVSGG
jgi:hypothetical protein